MPKSSKATYRLDCFYNGKASRAERGLEILMIVVVDIDQMMGYTAIPVQVAFLDTQKPEFSFWLWVLALDFTL